jgi:acetyl-CoA C-acetyltransferase
MPATATIPAIVGASQVVRRPHCAFETTAGPIELMLEAAVAAADDAGSRRLLERIDWIGIAGERWRYRDPGSQLANLLGSRRSRTALSGISGSGPQELLGRAAELIARGEIEVALVAGGDAQWTAQRLRRAGREPRWDVGPGKGSPEAVPGLPNDAEVARELALFGAVAPAYALMEDSLRGANGVSVDVHRARLATLWASFSEVAATNPHAWDREAHTPAEIREPTPENRMISFPYTKAMVANNTVDMASAVLLCSVRVAPELGISKDDLVFPHAVTKAHDTWLVANRKALHLSPALTIAGQRALALAGASIDEVEHLDLYACFPVIAQMAAAALGISADRPLTVTGGLGFAGAPLGNAAGQSIAAMVARVRTGGWGLVHANGGVGTKHAFGIYAAHPPERFVFEDCQPISGPDTGRSPDDGWSGEAVVEAATVVFSREGPSHVLAAVRPRGGDQSARGWSTSDDGALIEETLTHGLIGVSVRRRATYRIG